MTATKPRKTGDTSRRGFASMDPERVREIASMGGKATAPEKRSFSRSRELAAVAGRKGGLASHRSPKRGVVRTQAVPTK